MAKNKSNRSRTSGSVSNVFRRTTLKHDIKINAERNKNQAAAIESLIRVDAASRLPMPTASALAQEIREAQDKKDNRTEQELKQDAEEYNKNNDAWTQVNNIASVIALLLSVPTSIAPLISGDLIKHIPTPKDLGRVVRMLALDTREFVMMHNAIYQKYDGKSGSALTLDEQQTSREVFSQYINMFELWSSVVLPAIDHLSLLVQTGLSEWAMVDKEAATARSAQINELLSRISALVAQFHASYALPDFVQKSEEKLAEEALAEDNLQKEVEADNDAVVANDEEKE